MNTMSCLLVALACVAASSSVRAASNLGDDAKVAEAGECEVELAFERARARGEPTQHERALRLACGIGWHTELELGHARQRGGAARGESLDLEAKTTLRERDAQRAGWIAVLRLEYERRDGAWRRNGHAVIVEWTRHWGETSLLEAQFGTARDLVARRNRTLWTLAIERSVHERVELRAELEGDDREPPLWGVGLRWEAWPDHLQLNLSLAARSGSSRERKAGLGLQFEF